MIKQLSTTPYRGRFAPSPSGPLHFGSLYTALASYLDAHAKQGTWLVRIEDIDPPRAQPGAVKAILSTLEKFGLHWQEPVSYQSQRSEFYEHALNQLNRNARLFYCTCSRKTLLQHQSVYPGTCRTVQVPPTEPYAIRFKVADTAISFHDRLMGDVRQHVLQELGDFPIKRKDRLYAYQLAVVVDDSMQGITDIVRGSDLLDNTPRQIALQQALGYTQPHYLHLPIIINQQGQKLSKQTHANSISDQDPARVLTQLLHCLGQNPPQGIEDNSVDQVLHWAIKHWRTEPLPTQPISTQHAFKDLA